MFLFLSPFLSLNINKNISWDEVYKREREREGLIVNQVGENPYPKIKLLKALSSAVVVNMFIPRFYLMLDPFCVEHLLIF